MISAPFAHIAGIPIEETLGSLGPALLAFAPAPPQEGGAHDDDGGDRGPRGADARPLSG
jgi:hypothetical protein